MPSTDRRPGNPDATPHRVSAEGRMARNGHRGGVLWFTGLPGAGKSTIAMLAEEKLFNGGYQVYSLDGDNMRQGLSADLGFSPGDRRENLRRAGEVAALFADAGLVVIAAFISPYRFDRRRARAANPKAFHEIYVKASLETCERRDPKGLYAKARAGLIPEFTGVSAPYEAPEAPDLVLDTEARSAEDCAGVVVDYVRRHFGAKT